MLVQLLAPSIKVECWTGEGLLSKPTFAKSKERLWVAEDGGCSEVPQQGLAGAQGLHGAHRHVGEQTRGDEYRGDEKRPGVKVDG